MKNLGSFAIIAWIFWQYLLHIFAWNLLNKGQANLLLFPSRNSVSLTSSKIYSLQFLCPQNVFHIALEKLWEFSEFYKAAKYAFLSIENLNLIENCRLAQIWQESVDLPISWHENFCFHEIIWITRTPICRSGPCLLFSDHLLYASINFECWDDIFSTLTSMTTLYHHFFDNCCSSKTLLEIVAVKFCI